MLSNDYGERVWHVSVHIEDNASRAYRIIASRLAWVLYYQFFSFLHLSTTKDWPRKLPYIVFVVDRRAEAVRFVSSIPSMYVPAVSKQESKSVPISGIRLLIHSCQQYVVIQKGKRNKNKV
jgi:hypothetical protein